jgi:hypothetical protein
MTTYYLSELGRVIRLFQAPESTCDALRFQDVLPMRWIPCAVCTVQRFRYRERSIACEICKSCVRKLHIRFMHYCIAQIERNHIQQQKKQVHEELMRFCYHPDYVLKTGSIETYEMFNDCNG